ncbi:hypothetical protein BLX88_20000 [Bacillus obstructivus]|nr:hypothetical protein BLX88_20000 [Bacillus obstructivus]
MKTFLYRYLWLGKMLSIFMEIFYLFAVFSFVYKERQSFFDLAIITFLIMMGRNLGNTLASTSLRINIALLFSAKSIFILIAYYLLSEHSLYIVLPTMVLSAIDGYIKYQSNRPYLSITKREEIATVGGFQSFIDQITMIIGWLLSITLFVQVNSFGLLIIACLLGLICCLIYSSSPKNKNMMMQKTGDVKQPFHSFNNRISFLFMVDMIFNVAWVSSMIFAFVENHLKQGIVWWGIFNSTYILGMLMVHFIINKYHMFFAYRRWKVQFFLTILTILFIAVFAFNVNIYLSLFLILFFGFSQQLKEKNLYTELIKQMDIQTISNFHQRLSIHSSFVISVCVLGAGLIVDHFGIQAIYLITGLVSCLSLPFYISKMRKQAA